MAARPSFVIFYTDDHGYGDLGCMGARDLATPHLDRLAGTGALLTDWYCSAPVCSPSRASLLTGRYPYRAGVRSILGGHRQASGLPQSVPTLATALKPLGYRTAMVGKWHLGVAEPHRPHHHGFDEWYGFLAGCIDYYSHIFYWGVGGGQDPVHDLWENGSEVWDDGAYFTESVAERAVGFIDRTAPTGEPFLLYVPFNAPHYPMHAPRKYLDRFPGLPPERRIMAAMLAAVDDAVGAVVGALERHGLRESTCIYFQSDNGPSRETRNWLDGTATPYRGGASGPLKGHKFSLFEGGIRVPALVSWPERVPAGQVIREPGAGMDLFPTLLRAAGGDPAAYDLDGRDVLPLLAESAPSPHERLFWEIGDQTAVRQGPWKLVLNGQLVEHEEPIAPVHLANLAEDPGEVRNRAEAEPALTAELQAAAEQWRAGVEEHWETTWAADARPATGH